MLIDIDFEATFIYNLNELEMSFRMNLTNENVLHTRIGNIEILEFAKLKTYDNIVHGFSLKPLNFRNREDIHIDYKNLLNALKLEYKSLVKPRQNHTDNILIIDGKENAEDADINLNYLQDVDATITNKKGITLATTSADCLCIILYDDKKKVIANVHSGWRGTFKKIAQKTVLKMIERYGCNPSDIQAFLLPAIRSCHFEVDVDVMDMCKEIFEYMKDIDKIITKGRVIDGIQKYNIDNILININLLREAGILNANIVDSGICSYCSHELIHSRRADGEEFGLATTVVMMK